jgi:hypothetical protein
MWRREAQTLDPELARELDELEAALAGELGARPELVELAQDVRAVAPGADAGFLESLDSRVATGFERADRPRFAPGAVLAAVSRRRGSLLAATGVVAAAFVGVVAVGVDRGRDDEAVPISGVARETTGPMETATPDRARAKPPPAAGADEQLATGTGGGSSAARAAPAPVRRAFARKVEREVSLTLTTSPDEVQDVADDVVKTVQALGGYVQTSQVSTSDGGGEAIFTLRLPSARLDDGIERLSALAHVGALTQSGRDITSSFVSATDRLSDARATRRALLRALGRADSATEVSALRARLRAIASEIARYKGDLAALRRRADLATVALTVEGTGRSETGGGIWTPGDALGDAVRVLEVSAGVLLVGAAVLAPLALLVLVGAVAGRAVRRRRREDALELA